MKKTDIRDFSFEELSGYLKSIGEEPFRAAQIFEWIHQKGVLSFDGMNNLSKELRERLSQEFSLKPLKIDEKKVSKDGTTKFLFDLEDNQKIETVLIPTKTRTTVCVSTQAGCKFGIVDEVIPEPPGGAHHDPEKTATNIKDTIMKYIHELSSFSKINSLKNATINSDDR